MLYLNFTRPDIVYLVNQFSQFVQHPRKPHWLAATHILRYLLHIANMEFFLAQNSFVLKAFCDVDWATCKDTRSFIIEFCIYIISLLISWKFKKQTTISRSSTEAKYCSMASTIFELTWITYLVKDLHIPFSLPIDLSCDSQDALYISQNKVFHECTKHIK